MTRGQRAGRRATAAYLACAGLAIGSFGPWAAGYFGYSGIDSNGSLTFLAALLAAVATWRWTATESRSAAGATVLLGTLCVCTGVYGVIEIHADPAFAGKWGWDEGVGWGLALVLGAGGMLVLLATSMFRHSHAGGRVNVTWKQGVLLTGAGLGFLVGLLIVASGDPRRPAEADLLFLEGPSGQVGGRGIEQEILALRPGTSAENVMARLGPPASVLVSGDQSHVLYYGRWQLHFGDQGLGRRIKYVQPELELDFDFQTYDRRWRRLEREIRSLRPGTSIEAVKAKLGPPEGIEVYGSSLGRDVGLLYGEWRLGFAGRRFEGAYR